MAFPGHPLFDTVDRLEAQHDLSDYPALRSFLNDQAPNGAWADYRAALAFLEDHSGSAGTFNRFRGEIQRLLLYLWLVAGRTLTQTDSETIEYYFQFLRTPPRPWIATQSCRGFHTSDRVRKPDPEWRPFIQREPDQPYRAKQSTIDAATRALSTFFRHLTIRGYIERNPFDQVRRSKLNAVEVKDRDARGKARRLTGWQWAFLLETLEAAASDNPRYERHLFVVVTLRSLYLRVGELAPRKDGTGIVRAPIFGDFGQSIIEGERAWDFYVFGKGDKHRWVTVADAYLPYLRRWRIHLGLSPLPVKDEQTPILPKSTGEPLGERQVIRTVEESFALAAQAMHDQGYPHETEDMAALNASTHYLRHTGASMDIEAGRNIRHVSEDLGHSSVAFTEELYINADETERYRSGRRRRV